jgi:CHAT domain-containing protein
MDSRNLVSWTVTLGAMVILQLGSTVNASNRAQPAPAFQRDCPPAANNFNPGPVLQSEAAADVAIPIDVLRCTTFEAFQWAMLSEDSATLERVSAAFAAGDTALGQLERNRRAASQRLNNLEQERDEWLSQPLSTDGRAEEISRVERELADARQALATLVQTLAADYPAYVALSQPRALSVAQARALLRPGEVVVQILVNEDATYVWAVSKDRIEWRRVPELANAALTQKVALLRRSLAVPDVSRSAQVARTRSNDPQIDIDPKTPMPFEADIAYELYALLFKPLEAMLTQDSTLLVVSSGALSGIPLGVLLTQPVQAGIDVRYAQRLRNLSWMADRHTIVALPTLASLRALRCHPKIGNGAGPAAGCPNIGRGIQASVRTGEDIPLFGVGDPVLRGDATPARTNLSPLPAAGKVFDRPTGLANVETLRSMRQLPGTNAELIALSRQYGTRARILLRDQATETAIKASTDLPRARYVVFATHGLLTGDFGLGEPGLVLTPPDQASTRNDGVLTASEAAQLNLRAEFVVLSACNTANESGEVGGQGLRGLGPAFFYAGARSLLVSHWEVSDEATSALMQNVFSNLDSQTTNDPVVGRARAFAKAMKMLRQSDPDDPRTGTWVHPAFWGAFSFMGEPS